MLPLLSAPIPACDVTAAQYVYADVNRGRTAARLLPLAIDARLNAIALERANDLVLRKYFAHIDPEGHTAIDRLHDNDIDFSYAGENLAEADDASTAEAALWQSPEHRENLLEDHYRKMGVAVVHIAESGEIVVQIFTD